jgi:hypothetical protein
LDHAPYALRLSENFQGWPKMKPMVRGPLAAGRKPSGHLRFCTLQQFEDDCLDQHSLSLPTFLSRLAAYL